MPLPHASELRLLVFDLDGTLVDSTLDLANSVNAMLKHMGRPELPVAVVSTYVGDGASMLVRRALGDPEGSTQDEEIVQGALKFFLDYYRIHKLDHTRVYPGVLESLQRIRTAYPHLRMACLTNKPVNPSRAICRELGLEDYFFQNYGGDSFQTKKPDPMGLQKLMQEAGVRPEETLMFGDSAVDVATARNAGCTVVGCRYGFSPQTLVAAQPDALVDSASEWSGLFGIAG